MIVRSRLFSNARACTADFRSEYKRLMYVPPPDLDGPKRCHTVECESVWIAAMALFFRCCYASSGIALIGLMAWSSNQIQG